MAVSALLPGMTFAAVAARSTAARRWAPSLVIAPPVTKAFITPLASLSLVAARDPDVLTELDLTTQEAIGSREVLSFVFKKFGYDEASMDMDFLTFESATIARPGFAAFYGTNIQLAGLFSILGSCLGPLLKPSGGGRRLLQISPELESALWEELAVNIFDHLQINPTGSYFKSGDDKVLISILNETYSNLAGRFDDEPEIDAAKLTELFEGIAKVSTEDADIISAWMCFPIGPVVFALACVP
jgi:hypothetical protein